MMARSRKAWKRNGRRWEIAPAWEGAADLARRVRTTPLIAQVFHNRGLDDPDDIRRFLSPKLTDIHPPELMAGIPPAAERLGRAVRDGEKTCIYGDYDVDGMTGSAILYRILKMHGGQVSCYVPHRLEEGYGVNVEAIEKLAADAVKLLVTVDCGIGAVEPLDRARRLGMDVIVTDHHTPGEELPAAAAVVHPAVPGQAYPNPHLAGAGVAFKLAWQFARDVCGNQRVDEPTREFLVEATSLAALGTIADVVPLVGENRTLAVYGLKGLAATAHVGLRALVESAGLTGERLDAYHVGFVLAPRLNAAGRMGHARLALELLSGADERRSREIAAYLEKHNAARQQTERRIVEEAVEMVRSGGLTGPDDRAVVLASPNWHAGVVGIVASRVVERFGKPTVLIALADGAGQGSARSIQGFHMREALAACAEHLTSFGGHAMAGGLRLPAGAVAGFAAAFAGYAAERITPEQLRPVLAIDAEAALAELTYPVVEQLERMAPFGEGNPRPVVAVRACRLLGAPTRMGRGGQTVGFVVDRGGDPADRFPGGGGRIRCVGFGMGELADSLVGVNRIDIAGRPVLNRFRGRVSVEMHLLDVAWE